MSDWGVLEILTHGGGMKQIFYHMGESNNKFGQGGISTGGISTGGKDNKHFVRRGVFEKLFII
jgi:hypothetical protein